MVFSPPVSTSRRLLILILLLAAGLRAALAVHQPANLDQLPDQREYLSLAQNLRENHTLCFFDPRFQQTIFAYRMPGYPLLLAIKPPGLSFIAWGRSVQIVLDLSTIVAVYLIAIRLAVPRDTGLRPVLAATEVEGDSYLKTPSMGRRPMSQVGLIAAVLLAFNPFYLYFSSLILSETLFATLLIWAIACLIYRKTCLAAVLLIATCYVRPTGLLLLPILMLIGPNPPQPRSYRLSAGIVRMLISMVALALCLLPWASRNHHLLGSFLWTTTNDGVTQYDGFHAGATGASDQRFISDHPELLSMNELERSRFLSAQSRHWIANHPAQLPGLSMQKIVRGWSPMPLSREFGSTVHRLISVSYELPLDVLCLIGLFSKRLSPWAKMLLLAPAIMVTLGQAASVGSIRYRMPAEASMCVLAAYGLIEIAGKTRIPKLESPNE
jgi:hypothetical protein